MISSRADFLFFSALESEPEDASFFLADATALRALLLRAELQEVTKQSENSRLRRLSDLQVGVYLGLEGPATLDEAPRLKATAERRDS